VQAGIQCGGSRGTELFGWSCVPRTYEGSLHTAASILDARLRGHDEVGINGLSAVTRIPLRFFRATKTILCSPEGARSA